MAGAGDAQLWRVIDGMLQAVREGGYAEGARLPSETVLGGEYGVSRATVTRAMWLLRWIGLVVGPAGTEGRVAGEPMRTLALQLVERAAEIRRLNGDREPRGADPGLRHDCEPG